jgi:two-component sensor histidine kinase/ligand-binding sensor domain-containing protein
MATTYGLVRYDGKDFKSFGTDHGLKDNLVYGFHFNDLGEVWVSTEFGGVAFFDGSRFSYPDELSEIDDVIVNYITSFDDDEIYFGTDEYGVAIWHREDNRFQFIDDTNGLPGNQIWDIHFESESEFWITTMSGIAVFEPGVGVKQTYLPRNGNFMYGLTAGHDGRIWVATSNGVAIINLDGTIEYITQAEGENLDYVYSIQTDDEGTIWVGTERHGLLLIEPNGNTTWINRKNGLSSNFIYRLIKDKDGLMWVATDGKGVNLIKDRNFLRFDFETDLGANTTTAIKVFNDNTLWIGTEKGLVSYKDGKFETFSIPESLFYNDEIWDIEQLPNGDLVLLTFSYRYIQFDRSEFFQPDFYSDLEGVYINDLYVDKEGTLWFSAYGQLIKYDGETYTYYPTPNDSYWQAGLGYIYEDSRGLLWITTEGGLAKFENGNFEYFTEEDGIPGYSVYEIVEDNSNNLWVGTSNGITYLTADKAEAGNFQFSAFQHDELTIDETVLIHFDSHNGLWQGTNAGLYYYDLNDWDFNSTPRLLHFQLTDRGNEIELNTGARLEDQNGTVWFGTYSSGLVSFDYMDDEFGISSDDPPKIFIREILADDEIIYDQINERNAVNELVIDNEMNDVTFIFNAIDYKNPSELTVKYRLEGYDESWNEGIDINEIRYTNLPAGNYTISMQAKSIKSDWSEIQNLASFKVLKPYYLTIPFFLAVLSFIGLVIFMYINSRISRIEKRELQKLVDQQTSDLTTALAEKEVLIKEIHHRVKNNLAVVSGLLELQGFRMPAGSAKMAIQESKMRVIAMSKIHENLYQNDDLAHVDFKFFMNELIKSIQSTMDMVEKDIEVVQYMDTTYLDVNIGIPLGLITNELISNSYKHAFEGKSEGLISIRFTEQSENYELVVSDDGIGTSEDILSKNRKSLGVTLIKSLTAQISGELEYSNNVGSTFKLTIPKDQGKKSVIY